MKVFKVISKDPNKYTALFEGMYFFNIDSLLEFVYDLELSDKEVSLLEIKQDTLK